MFWCVYTRAEISSFGTPTYQWERDWAQGTNFPNWFWQTTNYFHSSVSSAPQDSFFTEAERPKSKFESKNEGFVALHCEITRKSRVELGVGAGGWNWDVSARKLSISQIGWNHQRDSALATLKLYLCDSLSIEKIIFLCWHLFEKSQGDIWCCWVLLVP